MSKCHHIYTHNDLDGAISLLVYMWSQPKEDTFHYTPIYNSEINKLKNEIKNSHNPSNCVILDLNLRDEFIPELDNSYVTIIDHHKSSERFVDKFKSSKIIYKEFSSNSLLMYKTFKEQIKASNEQKLLVALANDFDSCKFEIQDSYNLNLIFWTEYQNRFNDFIKDYYNGFKPFTESQKKAIEFLKSEIKKESEKIQIFSGNVTIGGKNKKICATISEKIGFKNIDFFAREIKSDIFFFINTKTETVTIKQCTHDDPIDCGLFAEKICDGKGHNNFAQGKITPLFMEVTKNLNPLHL